MSSYIQEYQEYIGEKIRFRLKYKRPYSLSETFFLGFMGDEDFHGDKSMLLREELGEKFDA